MDPWLLLPDGDRAAIERISRALTGVWAGMLLVALGFAAVIVALKSPTGGQAPWFGVLFLGVALLDEALALFVFRPMVDQAARQAARAEPRLGPDAMGGAVVVLMTLGETGAILGFVLWFEGGDWTLALLLAAMSLVHLVYVRPTRAMLASMWARAAAS